MSFYYLNVTVHVLAAMLWLGGMFFLGVVGAPVLRSIEPGTLRAEVFTRIGERFRTVGWWMIAVLIVTGLLNLHSRGLLGATLLETSFWSTRYGVTLAWKLGAVMVMVTASALHDFVVGPAAGRMRTDTPESASMRRKAALIARANALIGVVVVIAAVRLARGG